jgi:hypothetical protein
LGAIDGRLPPLEEEGEEEEEAAAEKSRRAAEWRGMLTVRTRSVVWRIRRIKVRIITVVDDVVD